MQQQTALVIFQKSLQETFRQYVDHSKVNGLWLLRLSLYGKVQNGPRRYFWGIILFSLLILGMFLSIMLWNKFYSLPTIVTLDNHVPITNIAFPGLSLCSPLMALEHKLERFINNINVPNVYTLNDIKSALRSLEGFTIRHAINKTRYEIANSILRENNITVYEAVQQIGGSCDDFLQNCYWGSKQFPCYQKNADLAFTTSISHLGFCCSFNYNPENQSYVPFSANNFGVNGGLVIVGLDRVLGNESVGLVMKLHHPLDYAVESHTLITLHPDSETFVVVYPAELSSSTEVLELSTKKRNCLIASDFKMSYYRQAGCRLNCEQQLIYKMCSCHPYQYPVIYKKRDIRDCTPLDIQCFLENFGEVFIPFANSHYIEN